MRILAKQRARNVLLAFTRAPRSVSEVASFLGEPVAKVFYYVRTFLRLGLLRIDHEEQRSGKPIKRYQTVATSFFLPAELIEKPFTSALAEELRYSLEHNFYRSDLEGVALSTSADGAVDLELRPRAGARGKPSAAEVWQILRLSDEDASSLASDIRKLLRRYEMLPGDGSEFLFHAAFARRSG